MTTTIRFLAAGIFLAALVSGFSQPVITKQPANQTASLFAEATFRVTSSGDAPVSYQWRFNNADLIDMTNTALTITNVQRANAGSYNVVVTNPSGSVTSQVATLTITPFNSIYCFGFSWTDTHNCAWSPPSQYYKGRACNGPMWPEFLSTNLGLAYVEANNYATCGAGPVEIRDQVISFPVPPKPQLSVYFVWAGSALDVTNIPTWDQVIQTDILNSSNAVNCLYTKGARQIVIQTHPDDLGKFPGYVSEIGTNSTLISRSSDYVARFNAGLIETINRYIQTKPDLRIIFVDIFSKLDDVLVNPARYGFTKTTIAALDDTSLANKTFTGPGADYVFWNGVHGTSKLHELMASWNLEALTNLVLEKLDVRIVDGSPNIQMNHLQIGRDYTLQKSTDLQTWTDVQSLTASAGTNQWSNSFGNDSTAYFRLKWEH